MDDKRFDSFGAVHQYKMMSKIIKCNNCGSETTNPRFCSRSCAAIATNKEAPKRKITKQCAKCETPVRNYRSTLCEHHFKEYQLRFKDCTVGEYREKKSVKGKDSSWSNSHIRLFAKSWHKDMANLPCAKCGYEKHVELAHIKSVSSFEDSALVSEVNARENIIQLCPNCHWEFDNLPREGLFTDLLKNLNKIL